MFIASGGESAIASGQIRRAAEDRVMPIQRRRSQGDVRRSPPVHFVHRDDVPILESSPACRTRSVWRSCLGESILYAVRRPSSCGQRASSACAPTSIRASSSSSLSILRNQSATVCARLATGPRTTPLPLSALNHARSFAEMSRAGSVDVGSIVAIAESAAWARPAAAIGTRHGLRGHFFTAKELVAHAGENTQRWATAGRPPERAPSAPHR